MIAQPSPDLVDRFREGLRNIAGGEKLGLAVSGGPDSLALLLLARAALPGRIAAATVDHGLRAEAAAEADYVAAICAGLDVPHAVLKVDVDPGRSSLQRAAREARYRGLAEWIDRSGCGSLATAHHADDQAETMVMRLLKGSGIGGLASVRAVTRIPVAGSGGRLIRPLLGWRRAELHALVRACGIDPVDDPSNRDERFDRVRIRRILADAEWIDPIALTRSAAALADAEDALQWATEFIAGARVREGEAVATLDPQDLPVEIRRRLLLQLLKRGEAAEPPRGEDVMRLIERLDRGEIATLGGVKCTGGTLWTFEREKERRG